MYEQLDDDLKKRIGEVFENIETPTADEGWLLLREKFPAKEKKLLPIFWYRLGAAAIFLFLLGISFLIFKDQTHPIKLANQTNTPKGSYLAPGVGTIKKDDNQHQTPDNYVKNKKADGLKSGTYANNAYDNNQNLATNTNRLTATSKVNNPIIKHLKIKKTVGTYKPYANYANFANNTNQHQQVFENSNANLNHLSENSELMEQKLGKEIPEALWAKKLGIVLNIHPKNFEVKTTDLLNEEAKPNFYSLLASSSINYKEESDEKDNPSNKKIGFSIYEATYLNYAKGSNNQINLGLGLTTDIYLAKNLKLITGINIGKNSLDYSSSSILNNNQNAFANAQVKNTSSLAPKGFTPATQLKTYNVGLVGLDIPLNLKYELASKKNEYYIVGGVSSGTFINETYSYQYTYQNSSAPINQQAQSSSSSKNFNSFYLAKTINIAFGADLPFGKNNVIFEPFIKYPIGGLGSQDIRFGASGLNLKFKF